MKRSRSSNFVAALIALFSVLFMQFAVAAYACPTLNIGQTAEASMQATSVDHESMSGCNGVDMAQPSLCHVHDQTGNQSLDKPELRQVQAFSPVVLVAALRLTDLGDYPVLRQSESSLLARTTAPPLSIRNCCFRI